MNISVVFLGIGFSLFSTMTLAYIMTSTGMGPWIAPTLVLMTAAMYRLFGFSGGEAKKNEAITIISMIGSVGGAVAMGVAWTFPVLYFLDASLFNSWLANPWYFAGVLTLFSLVAGAFGSWIGGLFVDKLLVQEALPFPVSNMVHKTITSQGERKQEAALLKGMGTAAIICFLRDGLKFGSSLNLTQYIDKFGLHLAREYHLFPSLFGKEFALMINPTAWAIGFTAGFGIALPLLVGLISKYLILYPLYHHASYLNFSLFGMMEEEIFTSSFCCGLAVTELLLGLSGFPAMIYSKVKSLLFGKQKSSFGKMVQDLLVTINGQSGNKKQSFLKLFGSAEPWVVILSSFAIMSYFKFPFLLQLFTLGATVVMTYQICWMGGKLGIASAGRFITFVMLPALLLFKMDHVQLTLMCTFVSICLMTAVNLLFAYKLGDLSSMKVQKVKQYNWLGLLIASLAIGICFWLLCTHFQLGSADLFAQRSKSRALLVQTFGFNGIVLLCGGLYGFLLKPFGISPTMLLGGLLMPNSLSIALILGACCTFLTSKPKEQFPFWSGIFTSETLWILLKIVAR